MTKRGRGAIVVCAFLAVIGLVLARGDFYDSGDSALDIAGWGSFMLAALVGLTVAVLSDRSNLSSGRRRRFPNPGRIAIAVSGVFAFVALVGFSHQATDPLTCSSSRVLANGIRVPADQGNVGGFPPGRVCREYAQIVSTNGSIHEVVTSEKKVPSDSNYFVGLAIVVSPLVLSMAWRRVRREPQLIRRAPIS